MFPKQEWAAVKTGGIHYGSAMAAMLLRITLLFGFVGLMVGFFLAPHARQDVQLAALDRMTTSSIGYSGSEIVHGDGVLRSASSICVIRENGTRSGNCR